MGMKRGIIVWMLVFAAGIAAAGCGNGGENEEIRESLTESGYEDENREIYFMMRRTKSRPCSLAPGETVVFIGRRRGMTVTTVFGLVQEMLPGKVFLWIWQIRM